MRAAAGRFPVAHWRICLYETTGAMVMTIAPVVFIVSGSLSIALLYVPYKCAETEHLSILVNFFK